MKIAIAGAGIGGLACAAMLAKDGHDVTVFDRFDKPAPVGSGLVLQPVGRAVLDELGTGEIADNFGRKITRMIGHECVSKRCVLDVSYNRSGKGRHGLALHRSALFEAVYQGALTTPAKIATGRTITGRDIAQNRLEFDDGTVSEAFELIVDAAGARSPLSPLTNKVLPFGALWGTVDWPEHCELPKDHLTQMYKSANRMLGVLPIGTIPGQSGPGQSGEKATIFWSLPADSYDDWHARPLADWRNEAVALWPQMDPFIQQITSHEQMTMARYTHATMARPWRDDRMVHIGDAAHRASPQLGQGANMALLDAYALCAALRVSSGGEALARYARARRWHVRLYQGMSYAFTPQYQSHSKSLPMLRDLVFAPMSRITPLPWVLSRLVCGDLIQPFAGLSR